MLGDIDAERGQCLAADLGARFERLDVTRAADWREAVAAAEAAFGRLDILVSNAGICSMAGLLDEDEATWDRTVAVNQTGAWHGMRAAVPAMERAGGGSVILVSSIWGKVGVAGATAYQARRCSWRPRLRAMSTSSRARKRGTRFVPLLSHGPRRATAGASAACRERAANAQAHTTGRGAAGPAWAA